MTDDAAELAFCRALPEIQWFHQRLIVVIGSLSGKLTNEDKAAQLKPILRYSAELNAFASKNDYRYYIIICTGLFRIVRTVCHSLLACSDAFPHVGRPNLDTEQLSNLKLSSKVVSPVPLHAPVQSNCERRRSYAQLMTILAMDFVILHEFVHICHGHLELLHKMALSDFIFEVSPRGSNRQLSELDMLTLEFDADSIAVNIGCIKIMGRDFELVSSLVATPAGHQDRAYIYHAAMQVLFEIFGCASRAVNDPYHPPPIYRGYYAGATACNTIRNSVYAPIADVYDYASGFGACEASVAFKKAIGDDIFTVDEYKRTWDAGGEYVEPILRNWKRIRPELDGLKLGGTLSE
jgi:hypothetical protein